MHSWIQPFYSLQSRWVGLGPAEDADIARLEAIHRHSGSGPHRILELGAGGGQAAFLAATVGHDVTAVELVPERAENARNLAKMARTLTVIEGSFYDIELEGSFDLIVYWDGFGVGDDEDQRLLLRRVRDWLAPHGSALIDVYTPWFAAASVGREMALPGARRRYDFEPEGNRWLDTWWPEDSPEQAVTQSLRCYAPADFRLLLEGTGLDLQGVDPGAGPDGLGGWSQKTNLARCFSWLATLGRN
jgi:SAM-dependent methyltransferase